MIRVTEQMVLDFRNEWLLKMLTCSQADFGRAEAAIAEIYRINGKQAPLFVQLESPLRESVCSRNKLLAFSHHFLDIERNLTRRIEATYSRDFLEAIFQNIWVFLRTVCDVHETIRLSCQDRISCNYLNWNSLIHRRHLQAQGSCFKMAYYLFFCDCLDMRVQDFREQLYIWKEVAESIYAWWPYRDICFLSDRPAALRESGLRLHSDSLPAVEFRDGNCLYFLNNIPVPKWVVTTPADDIDPRCILEEQNPRVIAEIIRKIGVETVTEHLAGRILCLDRWNDYELLDLSPLFSHSRASRLYLRMINRSTGQVHVEGVSPSCRTCRDALSWRIGDIEWNPVQIT